MFNYKSKIIGLAVGIATVLCFSALVSPAYSPLEKTVLTKADYPELFREYLKLFVGQNLCPVVIQSTSTMAELLKEQTGNELILKRDVEALAKDKTGCNLILFETPYSKNALSKVHDLAILPKVIAEYPDKGKGILEILASSWSKNKAVMIIDRIDEWEVKAVADVLTGSQELNANKLEVNCEKDSKSKFPYHSKIDATLSLLITLRGKEQVPHELKKIIMRETVGVSIRFTHELSEFLD